MFKTLRDVFGSLSIKKSNTSDDYISMYGPPINWGHESWVGPVSNIKSEFYKHKESIKLRALKRHDFTCEDTFSCSSDECGKFEPDKIVSEPYDVIK